MWECISHSAPWVAFDSNDQVFHEVASGERPCISPMDEAHAPVGWCDLMRRCWEQDSMARPEFKDVLAGLKEMLYDHETCVDSQETQLGSSDGVDLESRVAIERQQPLLETYYSCNDNV